MRYFVITSTILAIVFAFYIYSYLELRSSHTIVHRVTYVPTKHEIEVTTPEGPAVFMHALVNDESPEQVLLKTEQKRQSIQYIYSPLMILEEFFWHLH